MNKYAAILVVMLILCITNFISFCLMAYDKRCARNHERRVPEKHLFLAAACFGALGGVLAMKLLNHKTRHWNFKTFFPMFLMLQIIALIFVFYKLMF